MLNGAALGMAQGYHGNYAVITVRQLDHRSPVFLIGQEMPAHDREGNPLEGASFLMLFNAHHDPIDFAIAAPLGESWVTVLDTAAGGEQPAQAAGDTMSIEARSMRVLRRR
jgi:isoamylase